MKRRDFITLLGVAAAAWPLAARAQQRDRMRRLGVLIGSDDNADARALFAEFQHALEQLGWSYGGNIQIDIRWGSDTERRTAYAKELVRLSPDVIFAAPTNVVLPLQSETRTIPVVFARVSDPIGQGIVKSLARPNGNITGFSQVDFPILGKQVQLLKDIVPTVFRVGLMIHTINVASAHYYRLLDELASSLRIKPFAAPIREIGEIEPIFNTLAQGPGSGLVIPGDTVLESRPVRELVVRLASSPVCP